jgi:CMP-N-acetylneuraminic acid synthetase
LIGWTIKAAQQSQVLERLLVTTDSKDISDVAQSFGMTVPWLRPAEFSSDNSPSIDFTLHALDRLKHDHHWEPDAVVLLQPTSPFRRAESIRHAAETFAQSEAECLVSVSPVLTHPWSCYFLSPEGGRLRRAVANAPEVLRRQDLPPAYAPDGSIYITSVRFLRKHRSFIGPGAVAFLTPPTEAVDIDTPDDWQKAEASLKRENSSTH